MSDLLWWRMVATLAVQGGIASEWHKACREKHARGKDLNSHNGISMRHCTQRFCSNYKTTNIIYVQDKAAAEKNDDNEKSHQ